MILDFSKAIDKVDTQTVLLWNLLKWLQSFLSDCTQQIAVGGTFSLFSAVTSGVPQGSILGPVLFLAYFNDITANINSQLCLFVDDCLVY